MSVLLTQKDTTNRYVNETSILDMTAISFTSGEGLGAKTSTWDDTHTTISRTKALNSLSNPQVLAVQKAILVCDNNTVPTASIGIEADTTGLIGTYYGMNLFNNNDTDFGITSTYPYAGAVVFKQEGSGADTSTTSIKQGNITVANITPETTTITSTALAFTDTVETTTFNQAGVTTTADLTLDIGNDFVLNGASITENTAGGFTGEYLKIIINGTTYKLQLLAD